MIAGETVVSSRASYRGCPVVSSSNIAPSRRSRTLAARRVADERRVEAFKTRLVAEPSLPPHASDFLQHADEVGADGSFARVSLLSRRSDEFAGESAVNMQRSGRLPRKFRRCSAIAAVRAGTRSAEAGARHRGNLIWLVTGEEPTAEAKAFDVSLILYAEHEFNASTSPPGW